MSPASCSAGSVVYLKAYVEGFAWTFMANPASGLDMVAGGVRRRLGVTSSAQKRLNRWVTSSDLSGQVLRNRSSRR